MKRHDQRIRAGCGEEVLRGSERNPNGARVEFARERPEDADHIEVDGIEGTLGRIREQDHPDAVVIKGVGLNLIIPQTIALAIFGIVMLGLAAWRFRKTLD
jgi:hypothetical protein